MTKEELLNKASKLAEVSSRGTDAYRDLLEFFSQNVVIHRGENPHPYADVLHEWLEDTSKKIEFFDGEHWRDLASLPIRNVVIQTEYRIKPSEPVYEYQWCLMNKIKSEVTTYMASNNHLTDEEAKEWIQGHVNIEHFLPIKIEETKRVRQ